MTRTAAALTAALIGLGCGGGTSPSCPRDLPAACPDPAPSFANTVSAVFQERCATCHMPGGLQSSLPLTSYSQIQSNRRVVLSQVYGCLMPPEDAPALTSDERKVLLEWLVCGSPNN